jgi:argininosuccinate lyase
VDDSFASGSSLMPQKKNPDAAELLRAKAPRIVGRLAGVHGVLHALPLTYNKDLQEDKEPLFDTVDTLELCLRVAREMVSGLRFNRERMAAAASDEFTAATDVADLLVREGVPFREAHGMVGGLVRAAVERHKTLSELTDDELGELAPSLAPEAYRALLDQSSWLESKVSEGGTSLARVGEQLAQARHVLEEATVN